VVGRVKRKFGNALCKNKIANGTKLLGTVGKEAAAVRINRGFDSGNHSVDVQRVINRRHLTKGQRAMAVAMIHPEKQQRERNELLYKIKKLRMAMLARPAPSFR
jgi:hypothetical protein